MCGLLCILLKSSYNNGRVLLIIMKAGKIFFLLISVLMMQRGAWSSREGSAANILILNSYHHGFPWTDSIVKSIQESFNKENDPVEIHIEYMDTKRYYSPKYISQLFNTYSFKYNSAAFDCIISTDDDALDFLIKHRSSLFGKTPAVFAGINRLNIPETVDRNFFTGVMEEESPSETINLIKKLHPDLEKIYVVSDYTTTGRARYDSVQEVIPQYRDIAFEFSPDSTAEDIFDDISRLDKKVPVLILAFFRDSRGRNFSYKEAGVLLNKHAKGPVYTVAVNYLGLGVIGGVLNSPEKQGVEAAVIVSRILHGEAPAQIPVIRKVNNSTVVDYFEALKKGVDVSLIPDNAMIINRPPDFLDFIIRNKTYVMTLVLIFLSVTVFILTASIIAVMRVNGHRKRTVSELANALLEVKTLSGLLPICSSCKKIRDDSGYWSQIEQYLEAHSDAEFTHSLCPDCAKKLYPEIFNGEEKSD